LGHLVDANTVLLHQPPRRVGAVRRQIPVAVAGFAGVRRGVGVALDQQGIGQRFQLRRQQRQQLLSAVAQPRAAALEEGSVLALDQFNAQSLRCNCDFNLLGQFLEVLARLDLLLELVFELLQFVGGRLGDGFFRFR